MVHLHTMKLIKPHLLRLDLSVKGGKLLRHSTQTHISCQVPFAMLFILSDRSLCIHKTDSWRINLQEHNQQHKSDGDLRQESVKQSPLHFVYSANQTKQGWLVFTKLTLAGKTTVLNLNAMQIAIPMQHLTGKTLTFQKTEYNTEIKL